MRGIQLTELYLDPHAMTHSEGLPKVLPAFTRITFNNRMPTVVVDAASITPFLLHFPSVTELSFRRFTNLKERPGWPNLQDQHLMQFCQLNCALQALDLTSCDQVSPAVVAGVVCKFAPTLHSLYYEYFVDQSMATVAEQCHHLTWLDIALDHVSDAAILHRLLASNKELRCLWLWYKEKQHLSLPSASLITDELVEHIAASCPQIDTLGLGSEEAGDDKTTTQGLQHLLQHLWLGRRHTMVDFEVDICKNSFTFCWNNCATFTCEMQVFNGNQIPAICEVFEVCNVALIRVDFYSCEHINANLRMIADDFANSMETVYDWSNVPCGNALPQPADTGADIWSRTE